VAFTSLCNYLEPIRRSTNGVLIHTGSKGNFPWDRILKFLPEMLFGNENSAGSSPKKNARETVLQLLMDCGILGYGHRYNLLNTQWTHVACLYAGQKERMLRRI